MRITRRGALLAVAACYLSVACIGLSSAQDPRATNVQKEARKWLELTDRGDAQASWKAAGKQFQKAITAG